MCAPHATLRIKSFDSLNTQNARSSKLLQPQYRSLVSYHDNDDTAHLTSGLQQTSADCARIHKTDSVLSSLLSQDMSEGSGSGQTLVKARFSFQQTNEDELSFSKGDIISVSRQEEGGWWEGSVSGRSGWFPSNYVRELKGSGGRSSYHIAVKQTAGASFTFLSER